MNRDKNEQGFNFFSLVVGVFIALIVLFLFLKVFLAGLDLIAEDMARKANGKPLRGEEVIMNDERGGR